MSEGHLKRSVSGDKPGIHSEKKQKNVTPADTISASTTTVVTKTLLDDARNGFKNGNFVCSPLSLEIVLGMLAAGAEGQTLKQLLEFLGHESILQLLSESPTQILSNPGLDFSLANGVWVNKRLEPVRTSYQYVLASVYKTEAKYVDFKDKAKIDEAYIFRNETAVIWNPAIRKSVDIFVPDLLDIKNDDDTFVGFGVCPRSLDPMLVNITMEYSSEGINFMTRTNWPVEVFRLSSGGWKSLSINLPRSTTALYDEDDQVAIDRYSYWGAYDATRGGSNMILSFDMISEEFTEIQFPYNLACILGMGLHICKLKEYLAVFQFDSEVDAPDYHVWMMENGDKKTFTKIYTIMTNTLEAPLEGVFGSRKSGEPIIAMTNQSGEEDYELFEYEPNSGQVNHIGISAERSSFFVSSYTETLLLLDY